MKMNEEHHKKWKPYLEMISEKEEIEILRNNIKTKQDFVLIMLNKIICITSKELSRFLQESQNTTLQTLNRAEEAGYLYSVDIKFYDEAYKAFFLTNKGIERVADLLEEPLDIYDHSQNKYIPNFPSQADNKIEERNIPHTLAMNEIYLSFLQEKVYVDWDKEISLFEGEASKTPIKPDKIFEVNGDTILIEQDMGTTNKQRILSKFSTYASYYPTDKIKSSTLLFSIHSGKAFKKKEFKKFDNNYNEILGEMKNLFADKEKYLSLRAIDKEFGTWFKKEELEKRIREIDEVLKSEFIPNTVKKELKKESEKIDVKLSAIRNPQEALNEFDWFLSSDSWTDKQKEATKKRKELLEYYMETLQGKKLDDELTGINNKLSELKKEKDELKKLMEQRILLEHSIKRKEAIERFIDLNIQNKETSTMLDLFKRGFDMYIGDNLELSKFMAKKIKGDTGFDKLIQLVQDKLNTFIYEVNIEYKKNYNTKSLPTNIDYCVEVTRKDGKGSPVYLDLFDLGRNNIASKYRFEQYVEELKENRFKFGNRKCIVLFKFNLQAQAVLRDNEQEIPYLNEYLWVTDYDFIEANKDLESALVRFDPQKKREELTNEILVEFLKKINATQ